MPEPIGDLTVNVILEIVAANKGAKSFTAELRNVEAQERKTGVSTSDLNNKLAKTGLSMMGLKDIGNALNSTLSTIFNTIKSSNEAYQQYLSSNRQLEASSKLTGANLEKLKSISGQVQSEFSLSSGQANLFTIELTKLGQKAGDISKVQDSIKSLMDLGAGQGLSTEETLVAIKQALLGIDEGTDKLFQKNPSVIYNEFAKSIGTTAGKLTDQQKAQALLNAVLNDGGKLTGKYKEYLETSAGKQQLMNTKINEAKIAIGENLQPALLKLLDSLNTLLGYYNDMPALGQYAVLSFIAIGAAVKNIIPLLIASGVSFKDLFAAAKNLKFAIPFIQGFASEIAIMLGAGGIASIAILGLASLVDDLITLIKDAIYWKEKLFSIEEKQIKEDYVPNTNSDATRVPLQTDEKGFLKILTPKQGAEFLPGATDQRLTAEQGIKNQLSDESKILEDINKKQKTGTGQVKESKEEIKKVVDELAEMRKLYSEMLSGVFVNSKDGSLGDLSDTIANIRDSLRPQEKKDPGVGRVKEYYGPDSKDKRPSAAVERTEESKTEDIVDRTISFAHQLSRILGMGADNFVAKLLGGLQQGLSLANSFASLLNLFAGIGSGGIFSLLGFAGGGQVPGFGSGDTVPAMLTPGEFVINKSSASTLGTRFLQMLNSGGSVINSTPGAFARLSGAAQIIQVPYIVSHDLKGQDLRTTLTRVDKVNSRRSL